MIFKVQNLVLTCLLFMIIVSAYGNKPLPKIEGSEAHSNLSRTECWKRGGLISNENLINASSVVQATAVKMVKSNNEIIVLNYGAQFKAEVKDLSPKDQVLKTLNEGKARFLAYNQGELDWEKLLPTMSICQRVLDYKCLQDIVINTTKSLQEFNNLKCTELHGKLVIKGIGKDRNNTNARLSFEPLKKIITIRGRLIIHNVHGGAELHFNSLKEVGEYVLDKTLPSIRITNNELNKITFEKIELTKCFENSSENCVSIDNNKNFSSPKQPMKVFFKGKEAPKTHNRPNTVKKFANEPFNLVKERDEVESINDFDKRNLRSNKIHWIEQGFGGLGLMYVGLILLTALIIGVLTFICIRNIRNAEYYDMDGIENLDEVSVKEEDDDYFKVDKSSGMDDLGSN